MSSLRILRWKLAKSPLRRPLVWWRHRGLRPQDVFVAGYPKTGTTWLRFLLFEVLSGREATFDAVNDGIPDLWDIETALPLLPGEGRLLKTHEVYRPEYRKAIYVVRDVRDVVVSEYYFLKKMRFLGGQTFGDFVSDFLSAPVNNFGRWQTHMESWLDARDTGRAEVLVIRYEDMLADTAGQLGAIMDFLGVDVPEAVLARAITHNSKQGMRDKEDRARDTAFKDTRADIRFIRKAGAGDGREKIDPAQRHLIEKQTADTMRRLGYASYASEVA